MLPLIRQVHVVVKHPDAPLVAAGIPANEQRAVLDDGHIQVGEVIDGTDHPEPTSRSADVVRELIDVFRLGDLVGGRDRSLGHKVIVHAPCEVLAGRHTLDDPPRLERRLHEVSAAANHKAHVERPLRALAVRIHEQDIGEGFYQELVRLERHLDALQERLRDGPGMRDDGDALVRIAEHLPDREGEGQDCRLEVLASPQVQRVLMVVLALVDPRNHPRPVHGLYADHEVDQEEQVGEAALADDGNLAHLVAGLHRLVKRHGDRGIIESVIRSLARLEAVFTLGR